MGNSVITVLYSINSWARYSALFGHTPLYMLIPLHDSREHTQSLGDEFLSAAYTQELIGNLIIKWATSWITSVATALCLTGQKYTAWVVLVMIRLFKWIVHIFPCNNRLPKCFGDLFFILHSLYVSDQRSTRQHYFSSIQQYYTHTA